MISFINIIGGFFVRRKFNLEIQFYLCHLFAADGLGNNFLDKEEEYVIAGRTS